jgi:hypothetical protein
VKIPVMIRGTLSSGTSDPATASTLTLTLDLEDPSGNVLDTLDPQTVGTNGWFLFGPVEVEAASTAVLTTGAGAPAPAPPPAPASPSHPAARSAGQPPRK